MKKIERYILEGIKMPILFGISLFTFIFLIEIIVSLMESIIVKGISTLDTVRMLSFYLPPILTQTIPMGVFLGIMLTFTNFTRTSESTAMSSIGMSLRNILKPIVILSVIITAFIFFLQESIVPRSFVKLQEITKKIAYENPMFQLKENILIDEVEEYQFYIDKMLPSTNSAKNVLIFQNEDNNSYSTIILGDKIKWADGNMILNDSVFYKFNKDGTIDVEGNFEEKKIPLSSYFKDIKIELEEVETMPILTLLKKMEVAKDENEKLQYEVEINRKLAIPISTIALSILGVLLSIGHHRSGKGTNFGVSLLIIFTYIMFLNIGIVMANRGRVSPYIGVWLPNLLLFGGTALLYRKKASES